jgi:hypothetical protein
MDKGCFNKPSHILTFSQCDVIWARHDAPPSFRCHGARLKIDFHEIGRGGESHGARSEVGNGGDGPGCDEDSVALVLHVC